MRRPVYMPSDVPTVDGAFEWRIKSKAKKHIFTQTKADPTSLREERAKLVESIELFESHHRVDVEAIARVRVINHLLDNELWDEAYRRANLASR